MSPDPSGLPAEFHYVGGSAESELPADLAALAARFGQGGQGFYYTTGTLADLFRIRASRTADGEVQVEGVQVHTLPFGITLRELDVLSLLTRGAGNQAIADRLGIGLRTVTTHVGRLLTKLDVPNRTAAATLAAATGLVRLPLPDDATVPAAAVARPRQATSRAPLRVSALFSLHGAGADDGFEALRGTRLAVEQLNARGGVNGRRLELDPIHVDLLDPADVAATMRRAISREPHMIVTEYLASQRVAMDLAAEYGAPYLHGSAMKWSVDRVRQDPGAWSTTFQVCPTEDNCGPLFVDYMSTLRDTRQWRPAGRDLLVVGGGEWTGLLVYEPEPAVYDLADRRGWSLRYESVGRGEPAAWAAAARRVRESGVAAAMVGCPSVESAVAFVRAYAKDPGDQLLFLIYSPSIPAFRRLTGPAAEGVLWATLSGTYLDTIARPFVEAYRRRFGKAPGRSRAGMAYDRINLMAAAWSQVPDPRRFGEVGDALRRTVHRGVNGAYFLGGNGQATLSYPSDTLDLSISQAQLVLQIQDGRDRILAPSPYANGTFVPPLVRPLRAEHHSTSPPQRP
ncbi:ABC transporter substrate-binding protein [Pseudonocardia xishanensis]|uniref:HTH luxR-type domain-containing protein n=1 Tax=Pseudonocardia xishanensis TaxID=630995 RepID=A0ABP8S0M1_9PSEU